MTVVETGVLGRLLSRTMTFSVGVLFMGTGVTRHLTGLGEDRVGVYLSPALVVAFILGGLLICVGLAWPGTDQVSRAVERAGLYLSTAAWTANVIGVSAQWVESAITPPSLALVHIVQGTALALGCIGRAVYLTKIDRVMDRVEVDAQRHAREDAEAGESA